MFDYLESELFSSHTDKEFKSLKLKIKNEVIDKYKSIYRNKLNRLMKLVNSVYAKI